MPRDAFISHSKHDKAVAESICVALEAAAISCWIAPRDVRPARPFPGEITRAVQQSKLMVLIFSDHSNSSEQVFREVQLATNSEIPILPVRIEDVPLSDNLEYYLSAVQWFDAVGQPFSQYIPTLQHAIQELVGQSGSNEPPITAEATGRGTAAPTLPSPPDQRGLSPLRWKMLAVALAALFLTVACGHFLIQQCLETPLSKFIPDSLSTALVLISIAVAVAPYLAGQDIGPLKVPKVSERYVRELKIGGPFAVLIVLIVLFVPLKFILQQECNPLRNPSAEDDDAGWTALSWTGGVDGHLEIATDDFHTGKKSFKLSAEQPHHLRWVQALRLQSHTKYRLSAWVRTENVVHGPEKPPYRGANIAVQLVSPSQYPSHSEAILGTTGWHRVSLPFSTQDAIDYEIQLQLGAYGSITTGIAWFDDVKLEKSLW